MHNEIQDMLGLGSLRIFDVKLEMVCLEKVCYPLIVWFVRVRIIIIDLCVLEENNRTLGKILFCLKKYKRSQINIIYNNYDFISSYFLF